MLYNVRHVPSHGRHFRLPRAVAAKARGARLAKAHDFVVQRRRKAYPVEGGEPVGPKVSAQVQSLFGIEAKDLDDARERPGVASRVVRPTAALEAINVGDLGRDHARLVAHHADGEETKEDGLDEQADHVEHLVRSVKAGEVSGSDVSVVAQTVEKPNGQETNRVETGQSRVENK